MERSLALPSTSYVDKETNEKKYADDVKFISKEARKSAEDAILQAYQDKVGGTSTTKTTPSGAKKSSALPF
jgi:DNA-binding cell septation regulator SpoVG